MLKRITTDFRFEDSRGTIVQLIHEGYSQINVITSKKGVFRGGHYHKDNNEAFYIISGKLEVTVNRKQPFLQAATSSALRHTIYTASIFLRTPPW